MGQFTRDITILAGILHKEILPANYRMGRGADDRFVVRRHPLLAVQGCRGEALGTGQQNRVNPKLNAIVQMDAERIRAEAREADKDCLEA